MRLAGWSGSRRSSGKSPRSRMPRDSWKRRRSGHSIAAQARNLAGCAALRRWRIIPMAADRRATRRSPARDSLPESQFERSLSNASRLATVFIAIVVLMLVLKVGETILAPVLLALVIGLMFGPLADVLERR